MMRGMRFPPDRQKLGALVCAAFVLGLPSGSAAERDAVVVSIAPIHSLVAGVMQGVAEPALLIKGAGSPHNYALKPSDAQTLARARLIVWVGRDLETFLDRPLGALAEKSRILTLSQIASLPMLPVRKGARWDDGDNHGHDHHQSRDAHIWLDPSIAIRIVEEVVRALREADPARGDDYARNGTGLRTKIIALDEELRAILAPMKRKPYFVFHDAYQYFERRYGLAPSGAITLSPDRPPSARRLAAIRARLKDGNGVCVFREPQFAPIYVATIVGNTGARLGVLDPIGAELAPGPELWFEIMRGLGSALAGCLG